MVTSCESSEGRDSIDSIDRSDKNIMSQFCYPNFFWQLWNSNCDKTLKKNLIVTELKNSIFEKTQKKDCDNTQKLKLRQN